MNTEKGSAALLLTAVIAIVMALLFVNSMRVVSQVSHRFHTVQAKTHATQIASSLARQLRWAYDIARAVQADSRNANPCDPAKQASLVSVGSIRLCLVQNRSCIRHPANPELEICVSPQDGSLYAKRSFKPELRFLQGMFVEQALASNPRPPEPSATETNNHLLTSPVCLGGGCDVVCGTNADCLTYSFCPLTRGSCARDELVWQTLGLLR